MHKQPTEIYEEQMIGIITDFTKRSEHKVLGK